LAGYKKCVTDGRRAYTPIYVTGSGPTHLQLDLTSLRAGEWLNDEAINTYLSVLQSKHLDCYMHTSHLYSQLTSEDGYHFDKVKKWTTRGLRSAQLFDKRVVFFPRFTLQHWTLCVAFIEQRRIEYFDSLAEADGTAAEVVMDNVRQYLEDYYEAHYNKPLGASWTFKDHGTKCPQQHNGCDCGVFLCCYATYISMGVTQFDFSQNDIANFRRRIASDILGQAIDESGQPFLDV